MAKAKTTSAGPELLNNTGLAGHPPNREETEAKPTTIGTGCGAPEPEPPFLTQYRRCYPNNSHFYVTTDNMVFLALQKDRAVNHQIKLGGGEVKTY